MLRKLIERGLPGIRLTFVDPDDHYVYGGKYVDFDALYSHVVRRRDTVGLPPVEHLDMVIDHFLAKLPENKKYTVKISEDELPSTLKDYLKGGSLIGTLLKYRCVGRNCSVSLEIANERAKRCAGCIYNTKHVRDMGVLEKIGRGIVSALIKPNTTAYDSQLGQCILCGCVLTDKVFCRSDVIRKYLTPDIERTLPVDKHAAVNGGKITCWQRDPVLMEE